MAIADDLRALAAELAIRSVDKLRKAARDRGLEATPKQLAEALQEDAAKQVLAPAQRAVGKSAAEQPGSRLQADLMDFSKNSKQAANQGHRYAVQVTKTETKAVKTKTADEVGKAVQTLVQKQNPNDGYTLSTDEGREFSGLEAKLPGDGVHRVKDPADRNGLAVNDAAMQQVKQAIATKAAREGGGWAKNLQSATHAYNSRYHSSIHGSPDGAAKEGVQQFMLYQDQAKNFEHNRQLTLDRKAALEGGGAFRAPIANAGRSFNPK